MQAALYRRLTEFLDRFAGERHVPLTTWTRRLFEALDWGERATFSIEKTSDNELDLRVESCPFITVITVSPSEVESVYSGLNRAYNRDVPWVVATDVQSLGLFGSYWISFPTDVTAALAWELRADEFLLDAPKLNLLTPDQVVRNELDQLYLSFPLRRRRHPIDVHLVDRMAEWREIALEALGQPKDTDDPLIYRFINSLFLVRYLEDSGLVQNKLLGLTELNRTEFLAGLRAVFRKVRETVNYPTVRFADLQRLEPAPLKTLISELYAFKAWGVNYDFAAMSVDVLGRFYEEYLRLRPQRVVLTPRQRASATLFTSSDSKLVDVRQEKGIFYTPAFVVNYIVGNLIRRHEAAQRQSPPLVLDMACGSGSFLVAALEEIKNRRSWAASALDSVVGLDNDERAIEAARLNLVATCLSDHLPTPVPSLRLQTYNLLHDGPSSPALERLLDGEAPNIVLGNPPYISYERLAREYDLNRIRQKFRLAEKRVDSYMLFVEAALQLLKPGGFVGLVLPNVFLRSSSAGQLRAWFSRHADLLEVIDFQDQPVFQNIGVYVCVVLARKKEPTKPPPNVLVGKIYRLSNTPATQLAKLGAQSSDNGAQEAFHTGQPAGASPWLFRNPVEQGILETLAASSKPFSKSGLEMYQGVKTGLDEIFVLDSQADIASIEPEITVPLVRNRDLMRWFTRPQSRLIYPYDKGNSAPIPWTRIEKLYPRCASYLESHRGVLSRRRSLVNEKWYELIRPRVQSVFNSSPKLLIAELTVRARAAICDGVNVAIAGGTGGGSVILITDSRYELHSLLGFFNSSFVDWYVRQAASVRRGGWILIEQITLRDLPIPGFLAQADSFARSELARLAQNASEIVRQNADLRSSRARQQLAAIEEQIDSLVIEAAGLNAQQGAYIQDRVAAALRVSSGQEQDQRALF